MIAISILPLIGVRAGFTKADYDSHTLPLITSSEYGQFHALKDGDEIRFSVSYDNLPQKLERITLQAFSKEKEEILVTLCGDISEPSVIGGSCPEYPALVSGTITPDSLINHLYDDALYYFENLGNAIEKQLVILNLEIKK